MGVRRGTEVGVSDRVVLRCPARGERTILLGREDDWYREGSDRSFRCACGSRVRPAHRVGDQFLDLPGLPRRGAEAGPIVSYTHPPMGLGTAINVAAVLAGGSIGTLAGQRLPEGMRSTALQAIGLVTLLIGVQNFLEFGRASTQMVPTLTSVKVR
jgi:hypothetical protein